MLRARVADILGHRFDCRRIIRGAPAHGEHSEPRTVYVALFDIDSTLLRTRGAGRAAFRETFRADFDIAQIGGDITYAGRSDRAIVEEILGLHGMAASSERWRRFQQGYLGRLEHMLATHDGCVLPGVLSLLRAIRARRDVVSGLLTGNVAAGARMKLRHYGIESFFEFGAFGDDHVDRGRIAADALRAADRFLRSEFRVSAQPERTTVIGDTPADVRCARSIAAKAIAVATGESSLPELEAAAPDRALPDLTARDSILEFIAS